MSEQLSVGIALTTDPERSHVLLDEFCRCLGRATGLAVNAYGLWHYHHLLEGLTHGELNLVWLPPVLALRATARVRCIPIAIPVRHGVSTYSTALFTRPESSIRAIADLANVSAAWVDRQSAAGYLIIRALLKSKGVDLASAFAHEKFLGTHDAVAGAVLDGEVDVGATFAYFDPDTDAVAKAAGWGDAKVHIVCSAGPIPADIVAANRRLPEATRSLVQKALVDLQDADLAEAARQLLGADAFVAPDDQHIQRLYTILDNLEEGPGNHSQFPPSKRK